MNISGNNIEKWFFDYFEGNLSQGQTKQLFQFLDEHPWHAEEFNNWKNTYHVPAHDKHTYPQKASLVKKTPITDYLKYAAVFLLIFGLGGVTTYLIIGNNDFNSADQLVQSNSTNRDLSRVSYGTGDDQKLLTQSEEHEAIDNNTVANSTNTPSEIDASETNNTLPASTYNVTAEMVTSNASESEDVETFKRGNNSGKSEEISSLPPETIDAEENEQKGEANDQNINLGQTVTPSLLNDQSSETTPSEQVEGTEEQFSEEMPLKEVDEDYALTSSVNQLIDENHASRYLSNPEVKSAELDMKFNDLGLKRTSKLKKFSKSFLRMLDDPIALTNLRDPNLIIPEYNPIQFNAAFSGSMYRGRWETMHRYQWHNSSNAQHTTVSSFDGYVSQIKGGVGVMASFSDLNASMYRDYQISLAYSPKIRVAKNISVEPGVNFTVGTKTLNSSKFNGQSIEWNRGSVHQVFDNPEDVPGKVKLYRDMGAGVLLNTKWFYAGFHGNNLLEHQDNIYNTTETGINQTAPKRFTAVIGTDYQSFNNPYLIVSPFATFEQLGERQELWAGTHFRWNWLIAGASLSNQLDYKGMLGFQHKSFRMSYSYDETYSWVASTRIPSHELNIKIVMGKDYIRSQKTRY